MRCPTLSELPPPASDKIGWPWTEDNLKLPETLLNGCPWPKVSIVTPSYNQGRFIEETIRSVLLQGYPNLEYIIIDGGSTDNSTEIIKKYEPWLTYWVSEPDNGQTGALIKGFSRASGDIISWLNSDDILLPGAAGLAVKTIVEKKCGAVYGNRLRLNENGFFFDFDIPPKRLSRFHLLLGAWVPQETMFFRRRDYESVGGIEPDLEFAMDYGLVLRMLASGVKFIHTGRFMGIMRFHANAKSSTISTTGEHEFQELRARYLCRGASGAKLLSTVFDSIFRRVSFQLYQGWKRFWIMNKRVIFDPDVGYYPVDEWLPRRVFS